MAAEIDYNKYQKLILKYSYNGVAWAPVQPLQYKKGEVIEANSYDCGFVEPYYRWVIIPDEYVCINQSKYAKEKQQITYDNGVTWTDTGVVQTGQLIEANSYDCDYGVTWVEVPYEYICDVDPSPYPTEYLTTKALGNGIISLFKVDRDSTGMREPIKDIQYSKNNGSWTSYSYGTNISVVTGDEIRWKGTIKDGNGEKHYSNFYSNADYKVYGNPLSLLRNDSFINNPVSLYYYDYAYCGLFADSPTLRDASGLTLPATTLRENCYYQMFKNCTGLTGAPALPSTTLARRCYYGMFQGCTSLTTSPVLHATTLVSGCYGYMFQGCTSLNSVTCCALYNPDTNAGTWFWLDNVAATGTFVKAPSMTSWQIDSFSGIPSGWTTDTCGCEPITRWVEDTGFICVGNGMYNKEKEEISYDGGATFTDTGVTRAGSTLIDGNSKICKYSTVHLTTEALGSGDISLKKGGSSTTAQPITDIQYSKNNGAWESYTYDTDISVVTGDKIRWKGTRYSGNNYNYYSYFYSTADYEAYGNPLSLLKNDSFVDEPDTLYGYDYYFLFKDSSTLKNAYNLILPATTLANYCYYGMFQGCTSLTAAPELPATTLSNDCYYQMFYGCTSLTTAPALPATTLEMSCYDSMFYGCTSLTAAPELPATTLTSSCYDSMFQGCTSLTTAPALPATTLESFCYHYMFRDCTSLTTAPSELPATTLKIDCYESMFFGCTSLTTAPVLPATTLVDSCYKNMFRGCTSLNYIKCLATKIPSNKNCTTNWTYRVSSTGTFVKNIAMSSWGTGDSGIPSGWTVQNA